MEHDVTGKILAAGSGPGGVGSSSCWPSGGCRVTVGDHVEVTPRAAGILPLRPRAARATWASGLRESNPRRKGNLVADPVPAYQLQHQMLVISSTGPVSQTV